MPAVTPNIVAFLALLVWPIVSLYFFSTRGLKQAFIWTILGGYLLLPVGTVIKFPMVPGFDKSSIPSLAALVGCILFVGASRSQRSRFGLTDIFVLCLLIGPFITSEFNGDALFIGGDAVLPGVGHYDAVSAAVSQAIVLIPFFIARRYLRDLGDNLLIIRALAVAGIVYSPLMFFEVRFSPQLHTWIYGYFPHLFDQQMRDGGFRPVVFLGHGLRVAFFAMTAFIAAVALWKTGRRVLNFSAVFASGWLALALLLCKSLGSMIYGVFLAPVILWTKPRMQLSFAVALVIIALAYPVLRATYLFPTQALLEAASSISSERASSMKTRFDQEERLLDRASQRPWFGWGRYGRNRVYNEFGQDISVTDGHWIITLGTFGLFGFVSEFGLLGLSVFAAFRARRFANREQQVYLAAVALLAAVGMIDLLPNATISPWSWLMAGALVGQAEATRLASTKRLSQAARSPELSDINPKQLNQLRNLP